MGKLAASILAADFSELARDMRTVEPHVDLFHVDIMDGHFVPPIALGAVIVASIRPVTSSTLHGHLMVDAPEHYFEELAEAGLDVVSFHLEAVGDPAPVIAKARAAGLGVGITSNLDTPAHELFPYLELVDDVMLMSIPPGWSGQTLDPLVFAKLTAVREELERLDLGSVSLEVDGGVKVDNAQRCVDAGATVLIAASSIFGAADPAVAAQTLAEIVRGA